ncbi:MAG: ABC transporter substrate-binding protein, partial [bacterium]
MQNSKKGWLVGIIVILVVLVVYLSIPKVDKSDIKIGFVAPLTGDVASIGQGMKTAAELAVSEINNNGGINGRLIKLITEDGKCDGKEAVTVVNKLIKMDNVTAIVGGACASETVASAPVAEAN